MPQPYDHQFMTEYLMDGYEDDELEECPYCGKWIVPEMDNDDVLFCPECHQIIWEPPEAEAPQGVDVGDVPF